MPENLAVEKYMLALAERVEPAFDFLEEDLMFARIDQDPSKYLADALKKTFASSLSLGLTGVALGIFFDISLYIYGGLISIPIVGSMVFMTEVFRPRVKARKRKRKLEKDLPYALRNILIEVTSGISVYDAFDTVSEGYGEASNEFDMILRDVREGKSQAEAIEESISRNQSEMYRTTMWQILNALKAGTDMEKVIQNAVDNILEQQLVEVRNYGEDLNPFILMYLMIAVIFPSLGVTLLIILSSFTGMAVDLQTFMAIGGFLVVFQIALINLIKSRRPQVRSI